MGLHRVGHNWGDLAAAAAAMCISDFKKKKREILSSFSYIFLIGKTTFFGRILYTTSISEEFWFTEPLLGILSILYLYQEIDA